MFFFLGLNWVCVLGTRLAYKVLEIVPDDSKTGRTLAMLRTRLQKPTSSRRRLHEETFLLSEDVMDGWPIIRFPLFIYY